MIKNILLTLKKEDTQMMLSCVAILLQLFSISCVQIDNEVTLYQITLSEIRMHSLSTKLANIETLLT